MKQCRFGRMLATVVLMTAVLSFALATPASAVSNKVNKALKNVTNKYVDAKEALEAYQHAVGVYLTSAELRDVETIYEKGLTKPGTKKKAYVLLKASEKRIKQGYKRVKAAREKYAKASKALRNAIKKLISVSQ